MKSLMYLFCSCFMMSCVGSDTEFLPGNLSEAMQKDLLIKEYVPNKDTVNINHTKYVIIESFTTFKFNSKHDQTINKNFFAFIVRLKNLETNEEFLSDADALQYSTFINFHCNQCAGLDTHNIVLYYNDISQREKLDRIQIDFKDYQNMEQKVYFIKK